MNKKKKKEEAKPKLLKIFDRKLMKHQVSARRQMLNDRSVPELEEIYEIAKGIPDKSAQALFIILYLTAGRISEIVKRLKKKDFKLVEEKGRPIVLVYLYNSKNRKRKYKEIPIPLDREPENSLYNLLNQFLELLGDEDVLFPHSRKVGWSLMIKYLDVYPHYLRHVRLTHLITRYNFNEQILVRIAGWTDSRPAGNYLELRWVDILDRM